MSRRAAAGLLVVVSLLASLSSAHAQDHPRFDRLPESIREWIYAEQKLLSRAVDERRIMAPRINNQDPDFAPEKGGVFEVKTYWVDASKMEAFLGDNMPERFRGMLVRTRNGHTEYRLAVHPESESLYEEVVKGAERGAPLWATATASSRTLLVWEHGMEAQPFFAKLSLNKEIGGVVRTIPLSEVVRSVGINNVLHAESATLPASFDFIPEVASMIPKGMPRGGMIIRTIPEEILSGKAKFVPLFSLYATPPEGGPPLLARMIEKSGMDPKEFVRTKIVEPMAAQWFDMVVDRGIQMEPHAQNVLIELGKDGLPTGRFLHRDLGGFTVDFNHRERLGLGTKASLPYIHDFEKEYHLDRAVERLKDVRVYFSGGFLYNIDQELPKWQAKGWVKGDKVAPGTFEGLFEDAMSRELARRTGEKNLRTRTAEELVKATTEAREAEIKAAALRRSAASAPEHGGSLAAFFERSFAKIRSYFAGEETTATRSREATASELDRARGVSRGPGVLGAMDGASSKLNERINERTRSRTRGR